MTGFLKPGQPLSEATALPWVPQPMPIIIIFIPTSTLPSGFYGVDNAHGHSTQAIGSLNPTAFQL